MWYVFLLLPFKMLSLSLCFFSNSICFLVVFLSLRRGPPSPGLSFSTGHTYLPAAYNTHLSQSHHPSFVRRGREALRTLFHSNREGWLLAKRCVASSPGCTFTCLPQAVHSPQPPFEGRLLPQLNTLTWT